MQICLDCIIVFQFLESKKNVRIVGQCANDSPNEKWNVLIAVHALWLPWVFSEKMRKRWSHIFDVGNCADVVFVVCELLNSRPWCRFVWSALLFFQFLESRKNVRTVGQRFEKMMNYAGGGRSQRKLWWRFVAIPTWNSFIILECHT